MTDPVEKAADAAQTLPVDTVKQMMADLAAQMRSDFAKQLESVAAAVPVNQPADLSALGPVFDRLGMQIAELTDSSSVGSAPKRLAPAEVQARASAFEKMGELLSAVQAKPPAEWPIYKLVAKTQLNGKDGPRIVDPIVSVGKNEWEQVRIRHAGMPNLAMRPDNAAAMEIYKLYIRYIGGSQEANRIAPASPAWMTFDGTHVISGAGNTSARAHGREFVAEPIQIEGEDLAGATARRNSEVTEEMLVPNDPRRKEIHVLGTLSAPARVGSTSAHTV